MKKLSRHSVQISFKSRTSIIIILFSDPWQDLTDDYGKGGFQRITKLKNSFPHVKVTVAIGGWNEGSTNYSRLVSDEKRRRKFVKNAAIFVK